MRIALFQPDIPQNTGAILRLAACFGLAVDIIEPCGFPLSDTKLRRAGMDYIDHVEIKRHDSWNKFKDWAAEHGHRLVLVETDGAASYTDFNYTEKDILILGRESAGTPREVYGEVAATIFIPMREKMRSLNVAMAGAIVVGEMARQLNVSKTK